MRLFTRGTNSSSGWLLFGWSASGNDETCNVIPEGQERNTEIESLGWLLENDMGEKENKDAGRGSNF